MKINWSSSFFVLFLAVVAALATVGCSSTPPAEQAAVEEGQAPAAGAPDAPPAASPESKSRPPVSAAPAVKRPAAPPVRTARLDSGAALKVRTIETLSTKSNEAGDSFSATLVDPLVDGDWVVAPKGATVRGRVVTADDGGRVKGVASIAVQLTSITTADGQTVDISTNSVGRQARTTKKKDAAKVGIGAGIGAAIGAIAGGGRGAAIGAAAGGGAGTGAVLATRGDPAVIASETVLSFKLAAPVTITEKR